MSMTYQPLTPAELDAALASVSNYILMIARDLRSGELEPDLHAEVQRDFDTCCAARAKLEAMR